jgi:hypothetical protein
MCNSQATVSYLDKHPSLISAVSLIARTCTTIPPAITTQTDAKTKTTNHCFQRSSIKNRRISISVDARECSLGDNCDATIFAGNVMLPGSGQHYIEFKVLELRSAYVCVFVVYLGCTRFA